MREKVKRNSFLAILSVVALGAAFSVAAGCGDVKIDTQQLGLSQNSVSGDLSKGGVTPSPDWHNSYLTGAHSGYQCTDCHVSVARTTGAASPFREIAGEQICANCHMGDYNRTSLFNHSVAKAGTHCNACHYSDNFRSKTRISHTQYHQLIANSCLSCHPGKTPSSHRNDGRAANCESCHKYPSWAPSGGAHIYTANCSSCHSSKKPRNHTGAMSGPCESCHKYPSWKGASFSHDGVSSGCASCHSRHYNGYACEACHTSGISWSYRHSRVRSDSCQACHSGDGHGGGGGHDD